MNELIIATENNGLIKRGDILGILSFAHLLMPSVLEYIKNNPSYAEEYLLLISQYKFERISSRLTIKTDLSTQEETKIFDDMSRYIGLKTKNKFGSKGRERWYYGKRNFNPKEILDHFGLNVTNGPVGTNERGLGRISVNDISIADLKILETDGIQAYVELNKFDGLSSGLLKIDTRGIKVFSYEKIIHIRGLGSFMSLRKLKEEITTDPNNIGYSSMSAQEIVSYLNTKNISQNYPIPSATLLAWSGQNSRLVNIKNASNHENPTIANIAEVAYLMIVRSDTKLDLGLSDRIQMLGALVAAGILTTDDRDELLMMSEKLVSRADQLGFEEDITLGEVEWALAG